MQPESAAGTPTLGLVNARVALRDANALTLAADGPTAILIEDGRITHIGDDQTVRASLRGKGEAFDVHSAVIAPGLVDAHIHAFDCALASLQVSCLPPAVDCLEVLKQRLAERAAACPAGTWVVGTGYDDTRLSEHRHPSRLDLDAAVPDHPAVVGRVCGHMSVANTLALTSAGIDSTTADPPGGTIVRDAGGTPTGLLLEAAQDLVRRRIEPLGLADIKDALTQVGKQILGYGITTICEALLDLSHPLALDIWSEVLSAPWLGPGAVFLAHHDTVEPALAAGLPVIGTKLFADGVITGRTAALSEPFAGTADLGMLVNEPDELTALVRDSIDHGLAVGIHAMGDRGIATALDAIERAEESVGQERVGTPRRARRHRIEHCSLPSPESLERMRDHGIVPVPQPVFLFAEGEAYLAQLGPRRVQRAYPLRTMIDHRLRPALSSDAPATAWDDPINPWLGIAAAVVRKTWAGSVLGTTESVSVQEAMLCYTANGAGALGLASRVGTIAVGKDADLLVLNKDPFIHADPALLAALRPDVVLIKGRVVHGTLGSGA